MDCSQLYISTVSAGCDETAARYGLGLEIAEYCTAANLDAPIPEVVTAAQCHRQAAKRFVFHAPFNELCPAAIDPLAVSLARHRYAQALAAARDWGCRLLVVHTGFIPWVYYPEWFVEKSVEFWREFLPQVPEGMVLCLENVMEPSPDTLVSIAAGVDDPRLGLCLDVGHANTCVSRTPPLDWIAPMAPYLRHVHLHNNRGQDDLHAPLDEGTVPMGDVIDAVLRAAPQATFTIENQNALPSLQWLARQGYIEGTL